MVTAIINGRKVEIPDTTSDEEIRQAGGIKLGRNLIQRKKDGNFVVPPGSKVNVNDGDVFFDAPARIKG